MKSLRILTLAFTAAFLCHGATAAGEISTEEAIERLFTAPDLRADWFSSEFLTKVPLRKEKQNIKNIVSILGPYKGIVTRRGLIRVTFLRGAIRAHGHLTEDGQFSELLLDRMQSRAVYERLKSICQAKYIRAEWFDEAAFSRAQIERVRMEIASVLTQYGPFTDLYAAFDGSYHLEFAHKTVEASAFLGADGKLDSLSLRQY